MPANIVTRDNLIAACLAKDITKKKCFSHNSGIQRGKAKPTFSIAQNQIFLKSIFEEEIGVTLKHNPQYGQYYCFLDSALLAKVEAWEKAQGSRVFIADTLDGCIALDYNFNDNSSGVKTKLGTLEENAKHNGDLDAIQNLALYSSNLIKDISAYSGADFICAVPADSTKMFDLPRELAKNISSQVGKPDITRFINLNGKKSSIKGLPLEQKWNEWEKTNIVYSSDTFDLKGKTIILVDDKYQSGMTLQHIAMKLCQAGAAKIYGLCMVKTLKDTDNT